MSPVNHAVVDEGTRIQEVTQRLQTRFPQLEPGRVATVVRGAHREFDAASVRDFVPMLVEKRAREVLDLEVRTGITSRR